MRLKPLLLGLLTSALLAAAAAATTPQVIASIDLSAPFGTRSPGRFTATQAPDIEDPVMEDGGKVPGAIALCLRKDATGSCLPGVQDALAAGIAGDLYAEPHYLKAARVVFPTPARPLLLLQIASLQSVDGDQRIATRLFAYDRKGDRFVRVYAIQTGRNNNQETRYIDRGSLKGAMIAAEPTRDAPFGFWITVSRPTPAYSYRPVLRYRSATRYGDGNPLAVIDSEMPNILQRLRLWHPGQPLPLPAGACAKPRLIKAELWCA